MTAVIIDGVAVAQKIRQNLAKEIAMRALSPGLAVVLVGDDPASQVYVRNKSKAAEEVGIKNFTHRLTIETTHQQLLNLVNQLNNDPAIHGILVQLPLPKHIDSQAIIAAINPQKDVDGFHPINAGRLSLGLSCLVPCTPQGSMMLIKEFAPDISGKKAIVIGRSNIVGKPIAQLLLQANCTVTIAHSRTRNLANECSAADIVIAAIGQPEFVQGDWIKPGAVIIDVGINRIKDPANPERTKLVGDVAFTSAFMRAAAITPVPGGVGPMTIACLLRNTVIASTMNYS